MNDYGLAQYILTTLSACIGAWVTVRLSKPKTKAEIKESEAKAEESRENINKMITDRCAEIIKTMGIERDHDKAELDIHKKKQEEMNLRYETLENKIVHIQRVNSVLKAKNSNLEYSLLVIELEMKQIKKNNEINVRPYDEVFVLDDDDEQVEEFAIKLFDISVIKLEGFTDADLFMEQANLRRPKVLIIDMMLGKGITAEDVIKQIGYDPEILIMSVNAKLEEKFLGKKTRFFPKTDKYVLKICTEVVKYLTTKI